MLHLREPLRVCLDCGLEAHDLKDLELFKTRKGSKHGKENLCGKCVTERNRKWRKAHPKKVKESLRKYREANREKRNEQRKSYRIADPEKIRKHDREYYGVNRERVLKNQKKWRKAHPEKQREKNKQYYEDHREEQIEYMRKYLKANPFRYTFLRARKASKKKGLDFDLTEDYLLQLWAECGGMCSMTGVSMLKTADERYHPYLMSLDRIVPEKGYVKGNVRLVSYWYNRARSNYGDKLMLEMCQRVVECAPLLLKKNVTH